MLLVEIIFLFVIIGFIGAGLKDGFIQTLGRLVGSVLGFLAARAWSMKVSTILAFFMPAGIAQLLATVLIFIVITRLSGLLFKLVDGVFNIFSFIPFIKTINSFIGAFVGLGEGIILLGGCFFLIKKYFMEPHLVTWINSSIVAQWIEKGFSYLLKTLL
jgi:uncharacterized membrane protein required for colicin V production